MPKILQDKFQQQFIEKMKDVYPLSVSFLKTTTTNIGDWLGEIDDKLIEEFAEHKPFSGRRKQTKREKERDQDLMQCVLYMNKDRGIDAVSPEEIAEGSNKLVLSIAIESLCRLGLAIRTNYLEKWNLSENIQVQSSELLNNSKITHTKTHIVVTPQ